VLSRVLVVRDVDANESNRVSKASTRAAPGISDTRQARAGKPVAILLRNLDRNQLGTLRDRVRLSRIRLGSVVDSASGFAALFR